MATKLTEFLREQSAERQPWRVRRDEIVTEWTASLRRLYSQVQDWIQSSDPDGILTLAESMWEVREEGLGTYRVPRLDISGLRLVWLVPKARYAVATAYPARAKAPLRAAGRVDLSNEARRHILYRFLTDAGEEWVLDDQKNPPQPLTQDGFEAALMSYL